MLSAEEHKPLKAAAFVVVILVLFIVSVDPIYKREISIPNGSNSWTASNRDGQRARVIESVSARAREMQ